MKFELPFRAEIQRLDYEVELAVVLGADNCIAGYAVANDLSARDLQGRETQWTRAKGFDGSCPFGPWVRWARLNSTSVTSSGDLGAY